MWGSLGVKEFNTRPDLIECKTFMKNVEKKLQRKRKHQAKLFDELKEIVTSSLSQKETCSTWTHENETITRQNFFKENNKYIEVGYVIAYDAKTKVKTREALEFVSGPSDAYHIIVQRYADGRLSYDLDP